MTKYKISIMHSTTNENDKALLNQNGFKSETNPIGIAYINKESGVNSYQMWSINGQERFQLFTNKNFQGVDLVIITKNFREDTNLLSTLESSQIKYKLLNENDANFLEIAQQHLAGVQPQNENGKKKILDIDSGVNVNNGKLSDKVDIGSFEKILTEGKQFNNKQKHTNQGSFDFEEKSEVDPLSDSFTKNSINLVD